MDFHTELVYYSILIMNRFILFPGYIMTALLTLKRTGDFWDYDWESIMKYKIILFLLFIIYCGDNHIIQRSAGNYFPMKENMWWKYVSDGDTIFTLVEGLDTLLGQKCCLFSQNGVANYYTITNRGSINKYVRLIYNYGGDDYTVIESFVLYLELPFITGNTFQDSLCDSILVANQWIVGSYRVEGTVSGYQVDSIYGDVYRVDSKVVEYINSPDTTISDTTFFTAYYANNIGLIKFTDRNGEYSLIEYGE